MLLRLVLLKIRNLVETFLLRGRFNLLVVCFLCQPVSWATGGIENTDEIADLDTVVTLGEAAEEVKLEQSPAAVDVIDLASDQKLTADLSEVLSREPGISIRRMGGLGSRESFSLNGLRDEQIRFFIDGIPVEMTGYTFGIGSIPVNLIQRAEIYHGVVPIELGSDALGGAVNLITDKGADGSSGSVSYMAGDFNTQRTSLNLKYVDSASGFFSRLNGFYDYSKNNYNVDVTLPNRLGRIEDYTAKRFHDAYEGKGINVDIGYTEKLWADLLQLSLYSSEYYSEIQHDITMSTVYGEPTIERKSYGANLRYQKQLIDEVAVELIAGISEIKSEFIDVADYHYLWDGSEVVARVPHPGEIAEACDCTYWRDNKFGIINLQWNPLQNHLIKFSAAPTWSQQSGENNFLSDGVTDPEETDREMFGLVLGTDYTLDLFSERLQNNLFIKHYRQKRESDQSDSLLNLQQNLKSSTDRFGWGNGVRYSFYDWLLAKASYEQATRLPGFYEVFGNSENILPNTELSEEYSDNYNLSIAIPEISTQYGSWKGEVSFFLRDVKDGIMLMTVNDVSQYRNVASYESDGYNLSGSWSSRGDFITVGANYTNFDMVNKSDEGLFEQFRNQQIPNQPYTFYSTKVALRWLSVFSGYDELDMQWNYRHVDEFKIGWEDYGVPPSAPDQDSHSLAVTYSRDFFPYSVSFSAEVQNLTDQNLYDYYGVQRPGRAYYFKAIVEF